MEALLVAFSYVALFAVFTNAVPPDACFATFRWEDCGKEPKPVMYYWKPGSRCEVGIWRGCLPNLNMFKDEYECVSTCIFSVRAQPSAFHNLQDYSDKEENSDNSGSDESTDDSTNSTELTTVADGDNNGTDVVVDLQPGTSSNNTDTSTNSSDSSGGNTAANNPAGEPTSNPNGGSDGPTTGNSLQTTTAAA